MSRFFSAIALIELLLGTGASIVFSWLYENSGYRTTILTALITMATATLIIAVSASIREIPLPDSYESYISQLNKRHPAENK